MINRRGNQRLQMQFGSAFRKYVEAGSAVLRATNVYYPLGIRLDYTSDRYCR